MSISKFAKLAEKEINILQVVPDSTDLFVVFEYSWLDKDNKKHWSKAVQTWPLREKIDLFGDIIDIVDTVRQEISK